MKMIQCDLYNAFSILANHDVHRYLISNAEGRQDGYAKSVHHRKMVEFYMALRYGIHPDEAAFHKGEPSRGLYVDIHDHTQKLTSYLDSEIGFELTGRPSYETLVPKFITRFLELCHEAVELYDKP